MVRVGRVTGSGANDTLCKDEGPYPLRVCLGRMDGYVTPVAESGPHITLSERTAKMPPHCDSLDGPVVTAARKALEAGDVDLVLPFVPESGEDDVRAVFDRALPVRGLSEEARDVADRLFFENVVRIHRAAEGAPFTGVKPAGLDVGPVIPLTERAIATGSPEPVTEFLTGVLHDELTRRLDEVNALAATKDRSVADGREWVEAMLGFQVYSHHLLQAMHAPAHAHQGDGESHGHTHE
jgi:hypothetical protein